MSASLAALRAGAFLPLLFFAAPEGGVGFR